MLIDTLFRIHPSSILSQIHAHPSQSSTSLPNGVSPQVREAWYPPTAQHSELPTQSTTEWALSVPFGQSPPKDHNDRTSIASSPPYRQPPLDKPRGGFTPSSPPISPRAAYRQPIHRSGEYHNVGDYLGSSPGSRRPASMVSQLPYLPRAPHHQQPHFYGAPDIDFSPQPPNTKGMVPNPEFCCIFDSLRFPGHDSSRSIENVILVGFQRGLDIYHIKEKGLDHVGRLDELRGSVIGAKVLSFQPEIDRQAAQLLLVAIVHGPAAPEIDSSQLETGQTKDEEFDLTRSELQAMQAAACTHYQTTVDVYSLPGGTHIATLFSSPKVESGCAGYNGYSIPPPSVGDLMIQNNGRFIVVSSGTSGEIFIFESLYNQHTGLPPGFKCIGKVWTQISSKRVRSMSVSSNESSLGGLHDASSAGTRQSRTAIFSLSHRWLSIVPPPASSQTTLHGQIGPENSSRKIPGLTSHTSLTEPQLTCHLDSPDQGSMFNKVARDVAQGALKGAQWVAAEGIQAWTNYWSKPSEQYRQPMAVSPPNHTTMGPISGQQYFPPTHAQENHVDRAKNQPSIVSILDLEKLSENQNSKPSIALEPLATFSLSLGCSLVSFSPNGLHLLTASAKGDDQHVWDLMRMAHGEAGRPGDPEPLPRGPSVRQVAHYSRMTEARIIDVVWTEPRGERFAIVTERGTVHVNDLPTSAFQWPPLRRVQRIFTFSGDSSRHENKDDETVRPKSTDSAFNSALGMFTGKTPPFLTSFRGRSPNSGGGFSGFGTLAMTAGVGVKGGRAVAAGINRSVSAAATGTVNTLRHFGENRISLPASPKTVSPGCVRWLSGKMQGRIAVSARGLVRIYHIREASGANAGQGRPSIIGSKPSELSIPKDIRPPQEISGKQDPGTRPTAEPSRSLSSFWLLNSAGTPPTRVGLDIHPLSYAEIDTSAAYWPFHTDRRVNLYAYDENAQSKDHHHLHDTSSWVFGEPIPATKLNFGSVGEDSEHLEGGQDTLSQVENVINIDGDDENGQRIVMTTRRKRSKKGKGGGTGEEDEIFEDDCEVLDFAEERV